MLCASTYFHSIASIRFSTVEYKKANKNKFVACQYIHKSISLLSCSSIEPTQLAVVRVSLIMFTARNNSFLYNNFTINPFQIFAIITPYFPLRVFLL